MLYFIHGLNGNPADWNPSIQFLKKKGFAAEAIDLRAGKNLKKTHIKDYINTVKETVSAQDVIIGHSLGGLIVQKVAESTKIKAGICLCSAPPKGIRFNVVSPAHLKYIPFIVFNRPFKVSYPISKNLMFNCVSEKQAKKAYHRLHEESAKVTYEVMMNKIGVDEQKIKTPLFFIGVKNDHASPPGLVKKIAAKYQAPVSILPGCHYIFAYIDPIHEKILSILGKINYQQSNQNKEKQR